MDMSRRGRKRQLVVEDEYWALILAGVGRSTPAARPESPVRPATDGGSSEVGCRRPG